MKFNIYEFKNEIVKVIIVLLLLTPIYYIYLKKTNSLKSCHKITIGKITSESFSKGTGGSKYEYIVNGKIYNGLKNSFHRKKLINSWFPVIFNCNDTTFSNMLISPKDFNDFGYEFPDSLKWVLPILEE